MSTLRAIPPRAVSISEEIAAKFESLAARARAGEISSMAWIVAESAGNVTSGWLQDPKEGSRHELVAGTAYLQFRLARDADEATRP